MKKINFITSIACLIFLLTTTIGCKKSNVQTTSQKITGKWTLKNAIGNYTVLGSNRKDTTTYTSADYFDFKANGALSITVNNNNYTGQWIITNNKLIITGTNYIDFANGFNISILTSSALQLDYKVTDSISNSEQILNFNR